MFKVFEVVYSIKIFVRNNNCILAQCSIIDVYYTIIYRTVMKGIITQLILEKSTVSSSLAQLMYSDTRLSASSQLVQLM